MLNWKNDTLDLRKDAFLAASSGGMAHLASSFSCIEIIYSLYYNGIMTHNPHNPHMTTRDRFILSKGHGSLALYAVLCKCGYFGRDLFIQFTHPDSPLGGEPSLCVDLGIEASTGSLGHGLSLGVGMALAQKMDKLLCRTYVLLGDGECQEGSIWEAIMTAAKYKLDNLVAIVDTNSIQKMDTLEAVMGIDCWEDRFNSFGWDCLCCDGHDVDALTKTLNSIQSNGKPHVLFAKTVKGKGISIMENDPAWHWRMPNRRELKVFMSELNISQEELDLCKKHI